MINESIAHYRITEKLGQGGMGEVYRATDTKLDRDVAIKILPQEISDDPVRRKRFIKEAKAASALNHPHVCVIYEVSETEDGRPFIAMEYLPGQTLDLLPSNKPLDDETVVEIGSQVADALDAANEAGIIHRDIKPANIHRDRRGRVKVLDFGLAKRTDQALSMAQDETTQDMTEPGKLMGTPSYMSPEQTRCETLDHRSDLFSLGVVLYELTTGKQPFEGTSIGETVEKITREQPEAIARLNYSVSSELERIIRKCLEKKPDHRYQSARELLIDLKRLQRESTTQVVTAPAKRANWRHVVGILVVITVVCVLLKTWWSSRNAIPTDSFRYGKSVAVLPFRTQQTLQYVSDGLGQELSGRLNRLDSIERIPPFNASDRLRREDLDLGDVAEELNVSTLLRGNVRQNTQSLLISAELINPYSNSLIWQETFQYDQVKEVPFHIYQEIASSIAQALNIELSGEQEAALMVEHTSSARAWQAYLEGRHHWARRGPDLWRAKHLFELALSFDSPTGNHEDSEFALAWVGLADSYMQMAVYQQLPQEEGFPMAIQHAEHAIRLNPSIGDAYATLAFCKTWYEYDLDASMELYETAQRLNPQDTRAHYWTIWTLLGLGRNAQAIAAAENACQMDPLSDIALYHLSITYWAAGDIEQASRAARKMIARSPDLWLGHVQLARVLRSGTEPSEAVKAGELAVELSGRNPLALTILGQAYAASGDMKVARDILQEHQNVALKSDQTDALGLRIALGDTEEALELVEELVEQGRSLFFLHWSPDFRPLFKDPRYIDLVNQAGIARYNPETKRFEVLE